MDIQKYLDRFNSLGFKVLKYQLGEVTSIKTVISKNSTTQYKTIVKDSKAISERAFVHGLLRKDLVQKVIDATNQNTRYITNVNHINVLKYRYIQINSEYIYNEKFDTYHDTRTENINSVYQKYDMQQNIYSDSSVIKSDDSECVSVFICDCFLDRLAYENGLFDFVLKTLE